MDKNNYLKTTIIKVFHHTFLNFIRMWYTHHMKGIINWICGKNTQETHSVNHSDMTAVMRRVDEQIGRAVTRLSDR